ncbi:hypothetical protein [Methylobacterium nodulans]|uniref:hypothetical protein n=1 Tax=Methylobacterium nodulans TaxID=114616 RepID=UPI001AEBCC6F|nr:hypothetical protein [Methylobacterium nodulans]
MDDDDWRGKLFEGVEHQDAKYAAYRDLADAMPWLRREGVIKVRSPEELRSREHEITVAATLSDLSDPSWVNEANPLSYALLTQWFDGQPSWNVFRPKLPNGVVKALYEDPKLCHHLLAEGGDEYAWQLSYAAGSSIGINVHLAAAEELSLAPVTDSRLHHHLMLRKLQRGVSSDMTPARVDQVADAVATRTVFKVLEAILPPPSLDALSLEDILHFRRATQSVRRDFLADVRRTVSAESDPAHPVQAEKVVNRITQDLMNRARRYGAELQGARARLWPKLIDVARSPTTAGGTAAALAASYITGSGYVLLTSALLPTLGALKAVTEWKTEEDSVRNSHATSVAYLSQLSSLA